jgi:hypothetical protein
MFHGQVDIFMDVAFDSLHEDVRLLSFRLSSMSFGSIPIGSLECSSCSLHLPTVRSIIAISFAAVPAKTVSRSYFKK